MVEGIAGHDHAVHFCLFSVPSVLAGVPIIPVATLDRSRDIAPFLSLCKRTGKIGWCCVATIVHQPSNLGSYAVDYVFTAGFSTVQEFSLIMVEKADKLQTESAALQLSCQQAPIMQTALLVVV